MNSVVFLIMFVLYSCVIHKAGVIRGLSKSLKCMETALLEGNDDSSAIDKWIELMGEEGTLK